MIHFAVRGREAPRIEILLKLFIQDKPNITYSLQDTDNEASAIAIEGQLRYRRVFADILRKSLKLANIKARVEI